MYLKSLLLLTVRKNEKMIDYKTTLLFFVMLLQLNLTALNIENNEKACLYQTDEAEKTLAACNLVINTVSTQNCAGTTSFTAEWSVNISWSDAPIGDIVYKRNNETPQTITPVGGDATLTITGVPADGGMSDQIIVYFQEEPSCTDTFTIARPLPCPTALPYSPGAVCSSLQATEIGGTVFEDDDYDGDFIPGSVNGIMGVTVTAYNNRGTIAASTFTDANGNYILTGMTEDHYRIEFFVPDVISAFKEVSHSGSSDRSTVQFKQPGECASLGIAAPTNFCGDIPWITVPCYVYGGIEDNNGDAFVSFPVDTAGTSNPTTENMLNMTNVRHLATHEEVGATYGAAFSSTRNSIYTGAYMKRHVAFGPQGTGAIYDIDPAGERPPSVLLDLNTLFGAGTAGVNPHNYTPGGPCPGGATGDCWFNDVGTDSLSWYSVGRIGLGDVEISEDETHLYTINLANRTLYKIPIDNPTAGAIQTYAFPLNQDTDPNVVHSCGNPATSIRPMGLAWHNGKLYAGATCTEFVPSNTGTLDGGSIIYVYEFDPVNETWTLVLNDDIQRATQARIKKWRDYSQGYYANPSERTELDAFMILSDIEFENDTMILGTRDMMADIMGYNTGWPVPGESTMVSYISKSGDILRTCPNSEGSWYEVESLASCSGGGINNPSNTCTSCGIDGVGSYYYGDSWGPFIHVETSLGTLAEWPGKGEIFLTVYDPLNSLLTQGMAVLDHQTGALTQGYNLGATDLGKAAGLGDIEMICGPAPLMIGNRVWIDENGNGVQNPGEPGMGGVVVSLYANDGTKIAEKKTDAQGYYYFTDADLTEYNGGKLFLLNPNTTYYIGLGANQFNVGTGILLDRYQLTTPLIGEGAYTSLNDSDGTINVGSGHAFEGYPFATVTTGSDGATENSVDFGFVPTRHIGDYVWVDEDGDGDQDKGEPGIPNVRVELLNQGGTTVAITYTDMYGGYVFRNMTVGSYTVKVIDSTLPAGLDNQTYDPDGTLDHQHAIAASTHHEYLDADFGYNWVAVTNTDTPTFMSLGAIGDMIWHDVNGDGRWNPGEPGLENVEVVLYKDMDLDGAYTSLVTTVQTDETGRYIFENLTTAAYVVVVDDSTLPAGFETTPTADPDGDANNRSLPFVLAPGDVLLSMDFGYQNPNTYSVNGSVFIDENVNETKNAGEALMPNVTVKLMNASNEVVATTVSADDGTFSFTGLSNGNYKVVITDVYTVLDGMVNNADPDEGTYEESDVQINNANVTGQHFGYTPNKHTIGSSLVGNFVYFDTNANGSYQAGEPGIEGAQMLLMDANDNILAITQTNENGHYNFGGLGGGTYKVVINDKSINRGLSASAEPGGSAPADFESPTFVLNEGGINTLQDFGLKATTSHTLSGTIWEDKDAEGDLDESSTGMKNVTVALKDTLGNWVASTTTDVNGDYSFTGLPEGVYEVDVTDYVGNLLGYWHSTGSTPGADNNSQTDTYRVILSGGTSNTTADFGYYLKGASIGNRVWLDRNANGLQDSNEKGMEEAELTLKIDFDGNGTTEVSMLTFSNVNGAYQFGNLLLDEDYKQGNAAGPAFSLELDLPGSCTATTIDANSNTNDMEDSDNPAGITVVPVQGSTNVNLKEVPTSELLPASYDFGLVFDCSSPSVEYAMSLDASTNGGQTTDFFYMDSTEIAAGGLGRIDGLPASGGGHISRTQQHGRIRAIDYCEYGNWRYYYNPLDPDEYLFAIEMGDNVTEIDYVEVRIDDNASDRYALDGDYAAFVMQRDWTIKTVNDADFLDSGSSPTTVNMRFYFPPNEYKAILDAAIAQASAWSSPTTPSANNIKWFKKSSFNPDTDIDPQASLLLPYNITSLRNAATNSNGENTPDNTVGIGNAKNHIQFNGINSPSTGTAVIKINRTPLPVELMEFTGQATGCDVQLNWRAASELNFSHYELERSSDGNRFELVHTVQGNVDQEMNYHYFDREAAPHNYYRLKMVDEDGSYEYSDIVIVRTDCADHNADWIIYPNPISENNGLLTIKFSTAKPFVKMSVYDVLRQEVKVLNLDAQEGWNTLEWDMSDLPAGTYYITNSRAEDGKAYKFVVVK